MSSSVLRLRFVVTQLLGGHPGGTDDRAADQTGEAGGDGHNTRTRTGRAELDQSILDYLKSQSEPVRALDIRKGIGGTAAQIRTRLNYLIEKGKVTYKGRASGTRYRAK